MKNKPIVITLFSLVGIYLVLRAIYMPLLHDEIATFYRFVHIGTFIPYYSEWSTNNHVLNSLLTWISYKLLGPSPIAQRLPNLLFIPVYFYFIYKISGKIENSYLRWGFLILMVTIHNFMDYFCLSRGYGISLAMMSGAIWFTWKAFERAKTIDYFLALLFMFIAVSAILILVNTLIVIIGLLVVNSLNHYYSNPKKLVSQIAVLLFIGVLPVSGVVVYLFDLNNAGELVYGGMAGFWSVSVKNLSNFLVGSLSVYLNVLIIVIFTAMILVYFYLIFNQEKKNWLRRLFKPQFIFFYLLTGNIIGFFLEHEIFGILYPEDRTSNQFIPFFLGSLIFLLDDLKIKKQYIPALVLIPFAFFPVQFVYSLNFYSSPIDTFNYNIPERFYDEVSAAHKPGEFPPTVEAYSLRTMKWNYFNFMKEPEESCIHFNGYPRLDGDFQIVIPEKYPRWKEFYDVIDKGRKGELQLLERKHKLARELLYERKDIKSPGMIDNEYFNLAEGPVDTLVHSTLYFGFKVDLVSKENPFHGWLVITVFNKERESLRYEFIPFDWYRTVWNKPGKSFINGQLVHNLPDDAHSYVAYIWNIYKKPYRIDRADVSVFRLEKDYKIE